MMLHSLEDYVSQVDSAVTTLKELYPLDAESKVNQAKAAFNQLYEVTSFTTLDERAEAKLLAHPHIQQSTHDVREAFQECEAAFESQCADRIALAEHGTQGISDCALLQVRPGS